MPLFKFQTSKKLSVVKGITSKSKNKISSNSFDNSYSKCNL